MYAQPIGRQMLLMIQIKYETSAEKCIKANAAIKTKNGRWLIKSSLKDVHEKVSGFITAEIEKQFKLMSGE